MNEPAIDISWRSGLVARGARFEHDRVVDFTQLHEERHIAAAAPSITPLLSEGLVMVSGEDAQAFLQGQLSNDVTEVSTRRSQLAAYCSPKGRVLATALLWLKESAYVLQLPLELASPIARRLQMYVLRSRVKLAVSSEEVALIGVSGAGAAALVRNELGISVASAYETGDADGVTAVAVPGNRIQIAVAAERAIGLWDRLARHGIPTGQSSWEQLAIASGIASITAATQDQFVPQMLNFDLVGGVSFRKGCYPGQEIVARSQHLGQVKRRVARFSAAQRAAAGDAVFTAGQQIGTVVNATPSAHAGWEILAVVAIDAAQTAEPLSLAGEGALLQPLPLPYALPQAPAERVGDRG